MLFKSFAPKPSLKDLVKEFWIYEDSNLEVNRQKIIPDGFSEIIIHYGDPYRVNLTGEWETQKKLLFSNQISSYFYLENTGVSGMIGIKLFPTAFYELFSVETSALTDQVVPLKHIIPNQCEPLFTISKSDDINVKVEKAQSWLLDQNINEQQEIRSVVQKILDQKGMIEVEEISESIGKSTRQLERSFKKVVGLTPKFYARIIRFSSIFHLMESKETSWVKVALQSGYFDQSHFIKNFKEFTGEEPSVYGFDEQNLANFFLNK